MAKITWIEGGICAPEGFRAAGMHVGIKSKDPEKKDLMLIASDAVCSAAGVFTTNVVKAAPVLLDMERIRGGKIRAVTANSGIANACTKGGMENAVRMGDAAAKALGISPDEVLVSSTGVIGMELPAEKIEDAMPSLAGKLARSPQASDDAARAIMTTDTRKKEAAVSFPLGGRTVTIGGICKGSGMIHPNMGTMLCYLTTDAAVSPEMLQKALRKTARRTFNRISVDGDTSTNDTFCVLANGLAGNAEIDAENEDYAVFSAALEEISRNLARRMAEDGEGAQHLITCTVSEAESEEKAEKIARSVIASSLMKAAVFGCDANWGRALCAMGYSGETFDMWKVDIDFASCAGQIAVCRDGCGLPFDEELAKKILTEHEVSILISMHEGKEEATCWGCDLTYDYVQINGDYRT